MSAKVARCYLCEQPPNAPMRMVPCWDKRRKSWIYRSVCYNCEARAVMEYDRAHQPESSVGKSGRLKKGELVRVRAALSNEDWCLAIVMLASDTNPQSVMLMLETYVRANGGFVGGALGLSIDYEKETIVGLIGGDHYEIEAPEEV